MFAPLGWIVALAAAVASDVLPSYASRRAMGYPTLPYSPWGDFVRTFGEPAALPFVLLIGIGGSLLWALREDGHRRLTGRRLWFPLASFVFLVQYSRQGEYFFKFNGPAFWQWCASTLVAVVATVFYTAGILAAGTVRSRLLLRTAS